MGLHKLPPVSELAVVTLGLIVIAAVFSVAYLPDQAPLEFPFALISIAYVLMVVNAVWLTTVRDLAWAKFRQVAGWSLVAQLVSVSMIEYAFIVDDVRGKLLVMLSMGLFVYAVNIPLLLGFSVARYQPPYHR